jgi:hypothetical protein
MTEPNKTRAHIALFDGDEQAYSLGCELLDNRKNEVYHIFSLYLPRNEYPNKRQVINRIIPIILAEVPDDHVAVTFYSTLPHFRQQRDLERRNIRFAEEKTLIFKEMRVRHTAISLAIDAVYRRETITERL